MKIISLIGLFLLPNILLFAQDSKLSEFDKGKFEKSLPAGWNIETIKDGDYPYGFIKDENNNNGLHIFIKGSTDVNDKEALVAKESISIWIMPLNYSVKEVLEPGVPHLPAKLIGRNENSMFFILPWEDLPSWKTWKEDLIKYFNLKESLIQQESKLAKTKITSNQTVCGVSAFEDLLSSKLPDWVKNSDKIIITTVRTWINPDGYVVKTEILKTSGYSDVDNIVVDCIKKIQFVPREDDEMRKAIIEVDLTKFTKNGNKQKSKNLGTHIKLK